MASILQPSGLKTYDSELDSNKENNLNVADNTVIDIPNTIQKRRGFSEVGASFGAINDRLKQIIVYKNRILRHFNSTIQYDSDGNFTFQSFSGNYTEATSNEKLRYEEVNSNLYFTTNSGIKKLSASSTTDFSTASGLITNAGGVKAIDLKASVSYTTAGFLTSQSKCAYRVVWGINDKNDNLILGSPSERFVVTNTSQDINIAEEFSYTVNAPTLSYPTDLSGQYILISSQSIDYVFWFDVTGTDIEPIASDTLGKTKIKVDITTAANQTQVAAILGNAISNISDFTITIISNVITVVISDATIGNVTDGSSSTALITYNKNNDGSVTSGKTSDVDLTFSIPNTILTSSDPTKYFYQVYRTGVSEVTVGLTLTDIDPGDEMNLVLESPVTASDVTNGIISVSDTTPETFRDSGTLLYTNPISGEGISQANEIPPYSRDIALFRNTTFYANTKTFHRKQIDMLSVTGFYNRS